MKPLNDSSRQPWLASRDGLWPVVQTHGDLERAEHEWLHSNGAGAYSMSTLSIMHTRRQHGLLVAALEPPLRRHVILSHAETTVEAGGRYYRLSTHQFPNVAPTPGYRLLQTFAQDPLPRWIYQLGKAAFERTLCLVRGRNTVILGYTWHGRGPARLWLKPLMPLRPVGELMREHGAMMQRVTLRTAEVEIQPIPSLPPITFGHRSVFMGSPDWWRRFEYSEDRSMGLPFQEDMWTPGLFELSLEPGVTSYLVVSVGALPTEPPEELMGRAVEFLAGCDPGSDRPPAERVLCIAAEQFRADVCPRPATIAGYPLLDVRARDMVLSLPGLYLVQNRMPEAERVFATLRSLLRGGLLSDTLDQAGAKRRAPMPDATLWLFEAVREFDKRVPPDYPMLQKVLYPMLRRAFVRIRSKQKRTIWLTADGLIANYDEHRALTWMDAHLGARLVTPRRGLAVEFQALWSRGCETLAALGHRYGDRVTAMAAERACDAARIAFRDRFWCNETDYPFDTLSEVRDSADAWADPTVRPNALIALAVDPELFEAWQASAILERVRRELLTPHGIRSVTPRDERYIGQFGGSSDEHEVAYHQGTAWPHLLGFYARASARLTDRDSAVLEDLRQRVSALANGGLTLGSVGQIASGDAPHRWRGSPAYAMAVGELLRALIEDLA